jgi:hypothetical protein
MNPAVPMLAPVMALVLWSFVIFFWMYWTRIPAIVRARMRLDPNAPRGEQMATLPPSVRWKADNYNHLMEQPTLFYAVAIALAVLGDQSLWSVGLAWAYVGVRAVHSLWQVLRNQIRVRFAIFSVSALILLALSIRAALQVF